MFLSDKNDCSKKYTTKQDIVGFVQQLCDDDKSLLFEPSRYIANKALNTWFSGVLPRVVFVCEGLISPRIVFKKHRQSVTVYFSAASKQFRRVRLRGVLRA